MSIIDARLAPFPSPRSAGFTLIETIVFLLVVGIGVVGLLSAMSTAVRYSADPLPRKQALAIAEGLMEEISSAGFTFCQPQDSNFYSATSPAGCALAPEGAGAQTYSGVTAVRPYDNVGNYVPVYGAAPVPLAITDVSASLPAPAGYAASVSIAQAGLAGIPSTEALQIKLTVTGPNNTSITLDGFRTRFAPRASP